MGLEDNQIIAGDGMIEFRLVDIGEGLTQAEIVRWLVAVGDRVSEDEPVVEIETDKAVVEMPAPATGTVVALGGDIGDIVAVGEILVVIDDGSEGAGQPAASGRGRAGNGCAALRRFPSPPHPRRRPRAGHRRRGRSPPHRRARWRGASASIWRRCGGADPADGSWTTT